MELYFSFLQRRHQCRRIVVSGRRLISSSSLAPRPMSYITPLISAASKHQPPWAYHSRSHRGDD
eukprot:4882883-Prorocentrum_lima.AAC.1